MKSITEMTIHDSFNDCFLIVINIRNGMFCNIFIHTIVVRHKKRCHGNHLSKNQILIFCNDSS